MKTDNTLGSLVGRTSQDAWGMYAYLVGRFGDPVRVFEIPDPKGPRKPTKMDVATWTPMGPGSTALLCTVGGADRIMPNGKYVELFLLARPLPGDDVLRALAMFMREMVRSPGGTGIPLSPGVRLQLDQAPAPLDRFACLLVAEPTTFRDGFGQVAYKSGKKVRLLWLVPLFAQELARLKRDGVAALFRDFARRQVDLAQLDRHA